MTSPHVVVVGGGIGGLCLAQGLRRAGIAVTVHERDPSPATREQGYRISINIDGSAALRSCLPPELFDLCLATSIPSATRLVVVDHQLGEKFSKTLPQLPPDLFFGVDRRTLREILLAGLSDVVRFGSTFERFEHTADGRVRVWFTDGTSTEGDLLVGADGVGSAVRRAVAPDARVDVQAHAIYGRTPLGSDTLRWMPEALVGTFNHVVGPDRTTLSVATCRRRTPVRDAAPSWVALTDTGDYLSWTVSADEPLRGLDAAELHALALRRLDGWHPAVRRIVTEADVAATFPVDITVAQPVERLGVPQVTLLGDAIHAMSPGRGEGANIALRDAYVLRDHLRDVAAGTVDLATALQRYEDEILPYGFAAVANSVQRPFGPA